MNDDYFLTRCQQLRCNNPGIVQAECTYDSAAEIQHMCESLAENTVVHTFFVPLSAMKNYGLLALAQLLERNVTLKTLQIYCVPSKGKNIVEEGLPMFAEALAQCKLQNFGVENVDEAMDNGDLISSICNGIAQNTAIRSLCLSKMHINDNDALALGNALKDNNSIQSLHLRRNSISDVGIKHICNGLEQNCTISELVTLETPISSKGLIAISEMLKKNTSIKKIGNRVKLCKEAKEALVRTVIEDNFTLERISLDSCYDYSVDVVFDTIVYLNTDGSRRKIMQQTNDVPVGLWAHVFASFWGSKCTDVLFHLVKSKPELFKV